MTSRTPVFSATSAGITRAVSHLRDGGIVALPSETVYGLAGRIDRTDTIARIFAAKGRPAINPLIVHVADMAMARQLALFDRRAQLLAEAFWPGPLTLVLPRRDTVSDAISAGLNTVAIRMPAHPIFNQVLVELGVPLAAPSANASGRLSPTSATHVLETLDGRIDGVLDGGATPIGVESTVIALANDANTVTILRLGAITADRIARATHLNVTRSSGDDPSAPRAPGQLLRHYAPKSRLVLNSTQGLLRLGFGNGGTRDLSPTRDLDEAARNLFAMLYTLDQLGGEDAEIHVAPIPNTGIGLAINDRLARAAKARASEEN